MYPDTNKQVTVLSMECEISKELNVFENLRFIKFKGFRLRYKTLIY